jgi:uncharacterized protein YdeI (YjbR/CyaY-like superfamily)
MNEQVERFFESSKRWNEEMNVLREIVIENKLLEEDYKWMHPCYTFSKTFRMGKLNPLKRHL